MKKVSRISEFSILDWEELTGVEKNLLARAIEARKRAYAPYSRFKVGAAVDMCHDEFHAGWNVECITHSQCIHAEEAAISRASPGARVQQVAIALGPEDVEIVMPPRRTGEEIQSVKQITYTPCGNCLCVLAEHAPEDHPLTVLALQPNGQIVKCTLCDLYPAGFSF